MPLLFVAQAGFIGRGGNGATGGGRRGRTAHSAFPVSWATSANVQITLVLGAPVNT